jgi:hypothetical protein
MMSAECPQLQAIKAGVTRSANFDESAKRADAIALRPRHVRCRPTPGEFSEPVQRVGKFLAYSSEAEAEMRRRIEAIPSVQAANGATQDRMKRIAEMALSTISLG